MFTFFPSLLFPFSFFITEHIFNVLIFSWSPPWLLKTDASYFFTKTQNNFFFQENKQARKICVRADFSIMMFSSVCYLHLTVFQNSTTRQKSHCRRIAFWLFTNPFEVLSASKGFQAKWRREAWNKAKKRSRERIVWPPGQEEGWNLIPSTIDNPTSI